MNVWQFGSTSEFSAALIRTITTKGHSVRALGRATVDYDHPDAFIKTITKDNIPDIIIFNQNVHGGAKTPFKDHFQIDRPAEYAKFLSIFRQTFFFKLLLCEHLKEMNIKFVFITSSIAALKSSGLEHIMYRVARSAEHQLIYSLNADGERTLGICPGGLNDDNILDIVNNTLDLLLNDDIELGHLYFASSKMRVVHE